MLIYSTYAIGPALPQIFWAILYNSGLLLCLTFQVMRVYALFIKCVFVSLIPIVSMEMQAIQFCFCYGAMLAMLTKYLHDLNFLLPAAPSSPLYQVPLKHRKFFSLWLSNTLVLSSMQMCTHCVYCSLLSHQKYLKQWLEQWECWFNVMQT